MKKTLFYSLIMALFCLTSLANKDACLISKTNTFTNEYSIANDGYDVVAYFRYNEPRHGKAEHAVKLDNGVTYLFSSEENKDLFEKKPQRYLPQYGGFCAYAMAQNDKQKVDPAIWSIVHGRLYLNYSKDIQEKWEKDRSNYIKEANKNWKTMTKKRMKNKEKETSKDE